MRLPTVAIVTAFASGIALGFWPVIAKYATAPGFLRATAIAATLFIIIAIVGALKSRLGFSCGLSLVAWLLLGVSGAGISQQPEPPTYVLNLINSGTIDLHSPLRWHGTLRDEPATLPWGISYDIALMSVRSSELTERVNAAKPSATNMLARLRHRLRENLSALFSGAPQETAVQRAMLLGDRSLLDRTALRGSVRCRSGTAAASASSGFND
jgi:hypothetical protein